MVRASAAGAIDFAQADLDDRWWWRKLRWTLRELAEENRRKAAETQHLHWVTVLSNARLTDESYEQAQSRARELLQEILVSRLPWLKEQLSQPSAGSAEQAIQEIREEFGEPGDPRYEAMIQESLALFAKLKEDRNGGA